jgi:hypothetical protein
MKTAAKMGLPKETNIESAYSSEVMELRKKVGSDQIRTVDFAVLEADALRDMFDFWNKARDGMPLPCSSCIDPVALPKRLSQVFVIRVEHAPLSFWFRIMGEDVINAFGVNVCGVEVSKIESHGLPTGKLLHETYSWVIDQRKPVAMAGPNGALQDGFKRHEMIYLPFSNGSCQVTNILGASVYYRT